jgi:hypothetical protein
VASVGLHDVVKMLCPQTVEPKSVTLVFDRQISEAAFSDLMVLLVFRLNGGVFGLRFVIPTFSIIKF